MHYICLLSVINIKPSRMCKMIPVMFKYTGCCRGLCLQYLRLCLLSPHRAAAVCMSQFSCPCWFFMQKEYKKKFASVKTFHTRGTFIWAAARPSTGRSRSIWWHLSWRLWELQRPLSLPTVDSAVRKIRQRRFSRARRNSQRCYCFQQNSRKTTENKCRGERAKIALDLCNCACRQACKREATQNVHGVQIQWEHKENSCF